MSRHDALVSMAMILLRSRGEWQQGATAFTDIDRAVNECSDLIGDGTREACLTAIADIKRRCIPTD